jgi:hypothetical protein
VLPDLTVPTITITAWPDTVIDAVGHDPRSTYVEMFWLSILGPSTTWLLRRLVTGLDRHPDGYELPLAQTASALGLGNKGGRHSPFVRSLARCCQFGAATFSGSTGLAVRRRLPPLTRAQVERLPAELQEAHKDWLETDLRTPTASMLRQRARRLALNLAELGNDLETIEHQLHRWHFHPALARDAALWARDRQREAASVTSLPTPPPPVPPAPPGDEAA